MRRSNSSGSVACCGLVITVTLKGEGGCRDLRLSIPEDEFRGICGDDGSGGCGAAGVAGACCVLGCAGCCCFLLAILLTQVSNSNAFLSPFTAASCNRFKNEIYIKIVEVLKEEFAFLLLGS